MEYKRLTGTIYSKLAERNMAYKIASISLVTNLVLALFIMFSSERVIIVPAEITNEAWVEKYDASNSYVEQMSYYFVKALLDITPETSEYQRLSILSHVAAESYSSFSSKMIKEDEEMKKLKYASSFNVKEIELDRANKESFVTGELKTYVNGKLVKTSLETYRLGYKMKYGKLLFTEFQNLKNKETAEGEGL